MTRRAPYAAIALLLAAMSLPANASAEWTLSSLWRRKRPPPERPFDEPIFKPSPPDVAPTPPVTPPDPTDTFMLQHNLYPAAAKLGRGVANTLAGWMEVPLNMQKYYLPNDTGTSIFTGTAVGLFKGVIRTGVGVYETATFFLPYPEDFAPILPSLEYFRTYQAPASAQIPPPAGPRP